MGEVEVELPVYRHPESGQTEVGQVAGTPGYLLVRQEGDPVGGAAVEVERLPDCELEDPQERVPHVMHQLAYPVLSPWLEGSLSPVEEVEDSVPETKVGKTQREVDEKPALHCNAEIIERQSPDTFYRPNLDW